MSLMRLHEDSPISEYTQFDIIELDWEKYATFNPTIIDGTYTQGTSLGYRFTTYVLNNNNLYQALSTNCPRSPLDDASIMKNLNEWDVQEGVYVRKNTIMQQMERGVKPADFDTNVHYYGREMNTPSQSFPEQFLVYLHKNNYNMGTFDAGKDYFKDISTPENRMCRVFYSDAGMGFSCYNCAGLAAQYPSDLQINTFMTKNTTVCAWSGSVGSGAERYYQKPYYWNINDTLYNPTLDANNAQNSSARMWILGNVAYSGIIDPPAWGWNALKQNQNTAFFFIHTKRNNIDYYGIAFIVLSDFTENAYPTKIQIAFFSKEYWGNSVIAGGSVPSGNWGPVSGQSGGSGSWDNSDDSESIYTPPETSYLPNAVSHGGLHIYDISETELNKLSGLLFNPTSANNFWSKWLNQKFNPISGIISLHTIPQQLKPTRPQNTAYVKIAGATLDDAYMGSVGDGISAYPVTAQYTDLPDTFSLSIPEYFGSFYDYEPYTKCYLHLPFCGIVKISANEILGGSISVKYRCDVMTGNVGAMVQTTDRNGIKKMQYFSGNCAYKLPIVGHDDGGVDNLTTLISGGVSLLTGNIAGIATAATQIANREHTTTIAGDVSGNSAPLSDLKLWLEVVRVVPSTPENKQEIQGLPANAFTLIYSLVGTGYAEIDSVHLENIANATPDEITEIEQIMKNGVIF